MTSINIRLIDFYLKEASSQGRMGGVACSKSHQGTHFGPGTMNLAFIFKEEKVPSEIADPLAAALTVHSFACLAPSASELEDVVKGALDASLHGQAHCGSLGMSESFFPQVSFLHCFGIRGRDLCWAFHSAQRDIELQLGCYIPS